MNATVTLPIGDLDKLRNDLNEARNRVKELEINEREVRIKVIETSVMGYDWRTGKTNNSFKVIESYVAMNDVLEPLRQKVQEEEQEKINGLRKEVNQYKNLHETTLEKLHQLQDKFDKKEVKESKEELNKKVIEQDNTIEFMKSDLRRANEQIRDAMHAIMRLNNRTWWQRLINKSV